MNNEINFPKTHDLLALIDLCLNFDEKFREFDLTGFAEFGVEIRYDDLSSDISEAKNAFDTAKMVMDYVKEYLSAEK
jgi:HEPN domain-containing protein